MNKIEFLVPNEIATNFAKALDGLPDLKVDDIPLKKEKSIFDRKLNAEPSVVIVSVIVLGTLGRELIKTVREIIIEQIKNGNTKIAVMKKSGESVIIESKASEETINKILNESFDEQLNSGSEPE